MEFKEKPACQLFLNNEKLSRQKFARVDGQQGKFEYQWQDTADKTKFWQGKLARRLHEQGDLVKGKL